MVPWILEAFPSSSYMGSICISSRMPWICHVLTFSLLYLICSMNFLTLTREILYFKDSCSEVKSTNKIQDHLSIWKPMILITFAVSFVRWCDIFASLGIKVWICLSSQNSLISHWLKMKWLEGISGTPKYILSTIATGLSSAIISITFSNLASYLYPLPQTGKDAH